jgi:hypothetical protein
MTIKFFRNTSTKRFGRAKLPVAQHLIWAGPLFILIQFKQDWVDWGRNIGEASDW